MRTFIGSSLDAPHAEAYGSVTWTVSGSVCISLRIEVDREQRVSIYLGSKSSDLYKPGLERGSGTLTGRFARDPDRTDLARSNRYHHDDVSNSQRCRSFKRASVSNIKYASLVSAHEWF